MKLQATLHHAGTSMLREKKDVASNLLANKKSLANAKGNVQQQCMFEGPVQTKFKLTGPSNDVSFTLARRHDRSRTAVLAKNRKFFLPPFI